MEEENLQTNSENVLEAMEKEGVQKTQDIFQKLYSLWNDIGIDTKRKMRRADRVWTHIHNLLEDIHREENDLYKALQESVEDYIVKIKNLSQCLSIELKEIDGSLAKKEELLKIEWEKLNKILQQRLNSYQHLKSIESKYCKILGMKDLELSTEVPSTNDLNDLEQRIDALKEERDRRHKKFCLVKKDLTTILETTELSPETSFEKHIISGNDNFSLSDENMKSLEVALGKAKERKEKLETHKRELMDRLLFLWERLKVDEDVKTQFSSRHVNCCVTTVKSIEEEVKKYELLRKENIDEEISFLKNELEQLWSKCCVVAERERELFSHFSSSEITDEILETFEKEIEKWKHYYKQIEHIVEKINRRQNLWDKLVEFESKANDPNRFKNRGGNLLREEKERKMLRKELPKLENEIFKDIETYEVQNKAVFSYYGEDFKIHVSNQWEERMSQKENEKNKRQEKKGVETETRFMTPLKKSIMSTPKTAPSKLHNIGCMRFTPVTDFKKKPGRDGNVTPLNKKLFTSICQSEKKGQRSVLKHKQPLIKQKNFFLGSVSYSDFVGHLNTPDKNNHQSSVLMEKFGSNKKKKFKSNDFKISNDSAKNCPPLTPTRGKLGLPFII
ncbi:protein regulator of cytokinesis 1 [Caerostris extrusa]|uniref:Protein regulator of cytokinesis 1 n=1 Tax=Caerostris extrusa TaxID=172846 RepID=A0AAV4XPL6_CAEEX|nr:protein regulator of cytokinesis 1 [Caerostris extrusa]